MTIITGRRLASLFVLAIVGLPSVFAGAVSIFESSPASVSSSQRFISEWRFDTEIHSLGAFGEPSQFSEFRNHVSARFPHELTVPRFSADILGVQELEAYFSSPALTATVVSAFVSSPILEQFRPDTQLGIIYFLNALFSVSVFWLFYIGVLRLRGSIGFFWLLIALFSSPWLWLDLSSVHWNPAQRFCMVLVLPLVLSMLRSGKWGRSVSLLAVATLVTLGNGFELAGFAFSVSAWLVAILGSGIKRLRSAFLIGLGAGAVAALGVWLLSLLVNYSSKPSEVLDFVRYTFLKHSVRVDGTVPEFAVEPRENAHLSEAIRALLADISPFVPVPVPFLGNYPTIEIVAMLLPLWVVLLFCIGLILMNPGHADGQFLTLAAVFFVGTVVLLQDYAAGHSHILGSVSPFFLMVLSSTILMKFDSPGSTRNRVSAS